VKGAAGSLVAWNLWA